MKNMANKLIVGSLKRTNALLKQLSVTEIELNAPKQNVAD